MTVPTVDSIEQEYAKTYEFLCSLDRFGILLGLENITGLLSALGDPQLSFPAIHVGGSNGKGSTASMVNRILRSAGLRTALYTSPHLNDFRERIRIDDSMVSKEAIIRSAAKVRNVYDPAGTTFFEFTTAVAFDCIAESKPDLAVIEVGLGGRLDATNTVDPVVVVITDISREHEDYLGVGIESVAREKAGIIKPRVPLITGATRTKAKEVILGTAERLGAPAKMFGKDFVGRRTGSQTFTYGSPNLIIEGLETSMPGGHQIKNASMACAVAEELSQAGYLIGEEDVRAGIKETRFPGRFELLRRSPDVIIDGAHTPESMRLLKYVMSQRYPNVRPLILTGMLREKDWAQMVRLLASMAKEMVCVAPQGNRALDPEELLPIIGESGIPAAAADNIELGLQELLAKAGSDDVILAAGSLYMIGPVRRACGVPDA